jgi:predicted type IV restriction endonuclease
MENSADVGLNRLRAIMEDFVAFLAQKGKASEADTRVKLIDRVLKEVCGWPEGELSREDHVASGYTDYQLIVRKQPYVALEAKREGVSFVLPYSTGVRSLSLDGTLMTDRNVKAAIQQVRQYCDDAGIKFAIASNGYSWIVFSRH